MKNITIIQRVLPHYRVEFFKQLRESLLDSGVSLTLVYGQHKIGTVPETVEVDYEWAYFVPVRYFNVLNTELVYQKLPESLIKSDLLVMEQANRILFNYILLIKRYVRGLKVAYWGHGMNFQSKNSGFLKEAFKEILLTRVDWWFAYTRLSADIVAAHGFPKDKISVLNNSIDNTSFLDALNNVRDQDVIKLYQSLGIQGDDVCLYCGGLYGDKKIEFLLKSALRIRKDNPQFELMVIGSGPDQDKVKLAANVHKWIHYVGPSYGEERAKYFMASKLLLMPGLVGLVILDSFISKKPIVTTDIPIHSPEISYLDNGVNGVMSNYDEEEYSVAVNNCLKDKELYNRLIDGCSASSLEFTMDKMVENYKQGIIDCLNR